MYYVVIGIIAIGFIINIIGIAQALIGSLGSFFSSHNSHDDWHRTAHDQQMEMHRQAHNQAMRDHEIAHDVACHNFDSMVSNFNQTVELNNFNDMSGFGGFGGMGMM